MMKAEFRARGHPIAILSALEIVIGEVILMVFSTTKEAAITTEETPLSMAAFSSSKSFTSVPSTVTFLVAG